MRCRGVSIKILSVWPCAQSPSLVRVKRTAYRATRRIQDSWGSAGMILTKIKTKLGPQHHGRKMSLKAFEFAKVEEGWLCELARGYVVVSEVANYYHGMQILAINHPLWVYDA